MNKHILLVMKWLNDPTSVTQAELEQNRVDAYADTDAADAAADADATDAAYADAEKWVVRYFNRSGDNRQQYVDALAAKPALPVNGQSFRFSGSVLRFIGLSRQGAWVGQCKYGSFISCRPKDCTTQTALTDVISGVPGLIEGLDIPVSDIAAAVIKAGYHL